MSSLCPSIIVLTNSNISALFLANCWHAVLTPGKYFKNGKNIRDPVWENSRNPSSKLWINFRNSGLVCSNRVLIIMEQITLDTAQLTMEAGLTGESACWVKKVFKSSAVSCSIRFSIWPMSWPQCLIPSLWLIKKRRWLFHKSPSELITPNMTKNKNEYFVQISDWIECSID